MTKRLIDQEVINKNVLEFTLEEWEALTLSKKDSFDKRIIRIID